MDPIYSNFNSLRHDLIKDISDEIYTAVRSGNISFDVVEFIQDNLKLNPEEKEHIISLYMKSRKIESVKLNTLCIYCQSEIFADHCCTDCIRQYIQSNFNHWTSENPMIDKLIQDFQLKNFSKPADMIEWVPYEKFDDVKYKSKGGFSVIYTATWMGGWITDWDEHDRKFLRSGSQYVVLKALNDSSDPNDIFFKEALAYLEISKNNLSTSLINCFGMTKHPISKDFMLILRIALDGDLNNFLKNNSKLTWLDRYSLLFNVASAIEVIHNNNMVHRDLHPGNILLDGKRWLLCDLGFCGPTDKGQTFGIMPYVAPEALIGRGYTTASDIYSIGIIMWVLTSRRHPFNDRDYDTDLATDIFFGLRPTIISGTPNDYEKLMKECWDADASLRPGASVLCNFFLTKKNEIINGKYTFPELNTTPNLLSKKSKIIDSNIIIEAIHGISSKSETIETDKIEALLGYKNSV